MKRTISFLLALVLILGMVPFSAMALEPVVKFETETDTYINPLYADVITEADLVQPSETAAVPQNTRAVEYATTFADAGKQMREPMKNREETIVVYYQTTNHDSAQHEDIFNAAVAHTGDPDEGDALRWVYAGYKVRIGQSVKNGVTYVRYTYTMTYYTTAEQEAELEKAMDSLLAMVNPKDNKYDQFCTVYDYICENITYDYDNLKDNDYKLKYSAYAALVNGTAVCQGYAVLLYQLALELGIDCRVITGIGNNGPHGWNIVKFGDCYYNTDPTWDAIWYQALGYYNYFLQNEYTFTSNYTDHIRDAEYDTTEFHALYPISDTNFNLDTDVPPSEYIGDGLSWDLDDEGTLFITGSGEMINYPEAWENLRDKIVNLVIDAGVTKVGASAFSGCKNLSIVAFLGDAPVFGDDYVFEGVSAYAFYPAGNITWTDDMMQSYGGYLYWSPLCLEHKWGEWFTVQEPTCEENGVKGRICVHCEDYEEELIPSPGHSYSLSAVKPTCTKKGYTKHTCVNCGDSFKDSYVDPLGHNWDDGVVTKEPTEKETGLKVYTCIACGVTEEKVLPELSHTHNHQAVVTKPTCTTEGYTTYICACGDQYIDNVTPATGHAWDNGVVTKEPTEKKTGLKVYTCTTCGETKEEVLPKLKHTHKHQAVVTKPTCTTEGYTTYACECGDQYVGNVVAALGHALVNGTCSTCGHVAIAAPVAKGSSNTATGKPVVTWEQVEGAVKYEVYRATKKTGTYSRKLTTTGSTYTNTGAVAGKYYYYYVRAYDAAGNYADSNIIGRTCDLAQTTVTLSNVASTGKIKISWEAVEGATKYEVHRATSKNGTYSRISTTSNTSITNTKTETGKTYYYKVRAICDVDAAAAAYSAVKSRTCDLPQTTMTLSNVASSGKVKISWEAVEGATKYEVYRATAKDGTYSRISTTSNASVTNTKAEAGKTYYYKVRAICDVEAAAGAYSTIKSRTCDLPRPDVSIALSSGKPKVSWDAVDGAVSYEVYRATSKSGTYTLVKTTTSLSYKNTSATAGKTYYYKVVAVCSKTSGNSADSKVVSIAATK